MTVSIADVRWGSYDEFEGAVFWGKHSLALKPDADFANRVMYVMGKTESGRVDAVNAYDRCIVSIGLFQWCEAGLYLTSNLLGHFADHNLELLRPLNDALKASNAVFGPFKENPDGSRSWRFRFLDNRGDVDTREKQKQLFLLHSDGKKGSWGDSSRAHIKLWVACLANVLAQPEAIQLQCEFTLPRLYGFAMEPAKTDLFSNLCPEHTRGFEAALRTLFLSYAGNNPKRAGEIYKVCRESADWFAHSAELKFLKLAKAMVTLGFKIWPERYDKIAPALREAFGVDVPQTAQQL